MTRLSHCTMTYIDVRQNVLLYYDSNDIIGRQIVSIHIWCLNSSSIVLIYYKQGRDISILFVGRYVAL